MTTQLPQGKITILWTDVVDSMRMAGLLGDPAYQEKLRDPHRETLVGFFQSHKGEVAQSPGDGFMAVFDFADDALACADAIQKHFAASPIMHSEGSKTYAVQVRVGVHTARVQLQPGRSPAQSLEYGTYDVSFAFRVMSLASGGQILISSTAHDEAGSHHQYDWKEWTHRRIKSVDKPETVWELKYDGIERGEPGLRWVPAWYKGEKNRYIARPALQAEVFKQFEDRAFDGSASRLVTLKAEGGMGKTRLAIACAVQMAGAFADGVHFVNLAGSSDALTEAEKVRGREIVAETIGTALGLTGRDTQPEAVLASLQDRNALLILDNYEAVDCDEAAGFLADLVTQTTDLRLLVTGREAVKIDDLEQVLSLDDGMDKAEAEALFIAYARLKKGQAWTLSEAETEQLQRILELTACTPLAAEFLGCIPLAVELAAARVDDYSLCEIADGLKATPLGEMSRLGPRSRRSDPSPHHASLTRSLDWSYSLLEPEAQRCFATLGLFAESFTPDAVASITNCGTSKARRFLNRLNHASLVRRSEAGESSRYRLHRFTSAYANSRLSAQPSANATRHRFVAHYKKIVSGNTNINNLKSLNLLTEEWHNALAAVQTAEVLQDWQSISSLSYLSEFLHLRGLWAELERLCQRGVTAVQNSEDKQGEGQALNNLGNVYHGQGRWAEAEQIYSRSLAIKRKLRDQYGVGQTLVNLGGVYQGQGRWGEAEQAYDQSLDISRQLGDWQTLGLALNGIGNVYQNQGRWEEAEKAHNRSLNISRQLGDKRSEGQTLNNLGVLYRAQGRWDEAEQTYDQSLNIFCQLGDKHGEGRILNNRGTLYLNQNRQDEAEQAFIHGLKICLQLDDKHSQKTMLNNLGNLYQSQDRLGEAEQFHIQSLDIQRKLSDQHGAGITLGNLGNVYQRQGRWEEAEKAHNRSLGLIRQLGDKHGEGMTLCNLAMLMKAQGKMKEALMFARQAAAVLETIEDTVMKSRVQDWIAEWEQSGSSEK